jgi:hypothetical protein
LHYVGCSADKLDFAREIDHLAILYGLLPDRVVAFDHRHSVVPDHVLDVAQLEKAGRQIRIG